MFKRRKGLSNSAKLYFFDKKPGINKKAFLLILQKGLCSNYFNGSVERDNDAGIDADP